MNKDAVLDGLELATRVSVSAALVGAALVTLVLALHLLGVPLSVASAPLALFAVAGVVAAVAALSRRAVNAMTFRSPQH